MGGFPASALASCTEATFYFQMHMHMQAVTGLALRHLRVKVYRPMFWTPSKSPHLYHLRRVKLHILLIDLGMLSTCLVSSWSPF